MIPLFLSFACVTSQCCFEDLYSKAHGKCLLTIVVDQFVFMPSHQNPYKGMSSMFTSRWICLVLLPSLFAHLFLGAADANPPSLMTYQGFLTDSNGNALGSSAPANYDVVFRIYDVKEGGTTSNILWTEQQTVTIDQGYFSVLLGEGSQVGSYEHGDLASVFDSNSASDRFIGITVLGLSTGDVEVAPRLRLVSSPFSLLATHARTANRLVGSNLENEVVDVITSSGTNVGVGLAEGVTPGAQLDVGGAARLRNDLRVNGKGIIEGGVSVGKTGQPQYTADVDGTLGVSGNAQFKSSLGVSGGSVSIRPASGYALSLHAPLNSADYELQFGLSPGSANLTLNNSSASLQFGYTSGPVLSLYGNGWTVAEGNLRIDGSELRLGVQDGTSSGNNSTQRALVHASGDTLKINYNGEFEGGTVIESKLDITNGLGVGGNISQAGADFILGTNDGRDKGSNQSQRALVHNANDQLFINYNNDFEGGTVIDSDYLRMRVNAALPELIIDSTSGGDDWTSQGAQISIGESAGDGGDAQMNMTYTGNGWGVVGAGSTAHTSTTGGHAQFYYRSGQSLQLRNINGVKHITSGGFARWGRSDSHRGGSFYIHQNNSNHGSSDRYYSWNGDSNWDYDSDRRLKRDIHDERPLLADIMKVQVRQFKWVDDDEGAPFERGVIAQELEPLFPELVSERDHPELGESKMVGYSSFGLIAVKGVQELKAEKDAEIGALRSQNNQLVETIQQMQASIEDLTKRLESLESQ